MTPSVARAWTVIVLSGGTGRRLGGLDKALLTLGDRSLIDVVLSSVPTGVRIVVAGPPVATSRPVKFRAEDPPGGGPVAGIAAALTAVETPLTAVAAVDMPWAMSIISSLFTEMDESDADVVVPVDAEGRAQYLCSLWRTEALRRAVQACDSVRNAPVRSLLAGVHAQEWPVANPLLADLQDIDDAPSLAQARGRDSATTLGDHVDHPLGGRDG